MSSPSQASPSPTFSWRDPQPERAESLVKDWTLRNACVAFRNWRGTQHRSHFISRNGESATIYSFSEYTFSYGRIASVRREEPGDSAILATCARRRLGLAFTMSSNNLYHQFFHAVPAYLTLQRHMQDGSVFIPLVSYMAGEWIPPTTNYSHAWEFSVRALTDMTPRDITTDALQLLRRQCTCFDRIEGNTGGVSLFNSGARSQVIAFCQAALRRARALPAMELPAAERAWERRRILGRGIGGSGGALGAGSVESTTVLYVRRSGARRVQTDHQRNQRDQGNLHEGPRLRGPRGACSRL